MRRFFAVVVYRCEVGGFLSEDGTLDFQTRFFRAESEEEVVRMVQEEETSSYLNGDGREVTWPLQAIMAVDELDSCSSGTEVAGFITRAGELTDLGETTPDEFCDCAELDSLLLVCRRTRNPIACATCRGEVPMEWLGLDTEGIKELVYFRELYRSLDFLWLDSGAYEEWARSELLHPSSALNLTGREMTATLNQIRPTYYWWFRDVGVEDPPPMTDCPVCEQELVERFRALVCETCKVYVENGYHHDRKE
ncbi:MAG: DUF2310 family Zn-ribbon-containing protein [Planctomycetota bacterium]